jgi:hypothetical protein
VHLQCISYFNDLLVGMEPRRKSGTVCFLVLDMPEANMQPRGCGVETFCDLQRVKPVFLQVERL